MFYLSLTVDDIRQVDLESDDEEYISERITDHLQHRWPHGDDYRPLSRNGYVLWRDDELIELRLAN